MTEYLKLDLTKLEIPVPRQFLEEFLVRSKGEFTGKTALDVGAGLSPHRHLLESHGLSYISHDFSLYEESNDEPGFATRGWDYPKHDIVCDVLEIPETRQFDFVICTEVLEHVPDPQATLRKIRRLIKPGGHVFISVPAMSFVHQAPFYFSSGLSTYWFDYWAKELDLDVVRLVSVGDYSDFMAQEVHRIFYSVPRSWLSGRSLIQVLIDRTIHSRSRHFLNKRLKFLGEDVLTSSPMNTIFIGRAPLYR